MKKKYPKEEKRRIKRSVFLLLLLLLLFGCAAVIALTVRRGPGGNRPDAVSGKKAGSGVELVIDPNAETGLPGQSDSALEQGVVIAGWESMTFLADTKEAAVDFRNPEENAGLYYLTFEIRLYDDSGRDYEVLYTSGLVEPGKRIDRITLPRELEKGVYDAVVHVQPYRMDEEKTQTNNVDMRIKLIVD